MFVSDWMTKKVFTAAPDDSVYDAINLMKEKKVKHLPVLKNGKVKGIISDRDIKEFGPSQATALDIFELHYVLAKTRVREIMSSKVRTSAPDLPIEEAAMLLYDMDIGCLPVVAGGRLVGIISDRDIFRALIDITGIRHGGLRVFLTIGDRPGSIKEVADIIRKHGFGLQSVLTSYEKAKEGYRHIVIRANGKGDFKALRSELESSYIGVMIRKG